MSMRVNTLPDFDEHRNGLMRLSVEAWHEFGKHPPAALVFPRLADEKLLRTVGVTEVDLNTGGPVCFALGSEGITEIGQWVERIRTVAKQCDAAQVFVVVESSVARYDSPAAARDVARAVKRAAEHGLVTELAGSRRVLMVHFERSERAEVWLAPVVEVNAEETSSSTADFDVAEVIPSLHRPASIRELSPTVTNCIQVSTLKLGPWERYLSDGDHPSPFGGLLP